VRIVSVRMNFEADDIASGDGDRIHIGAESGFI
jgi:hypothetical protein